MSINPSESKWQVQSVKRFARDAIDHLTLIYIHIVSGIYVVSRYDLKHWFQSYFKVNGNNIIRTQQTHKIETLFLSENCSSIMCSVSIVARTTTTEIPTRTTTTTSAKRAARFVNHRNNVMQVSPAVVAFMCLQHSQQQIPMLNNFMCMRMRGWHSNNNYYNNYLSVSGITPTKTVLKRTKGLRKKRDTIIRRNICRCSFRFCGSK